MQCRQSETGSKPADGGTPFKFRGRLSLALTPVVPRHGHFPERVCRTSLKVACAGASQRGSADWARFTA